MREFSTEVTGRTVGLDIGDRYSHFCIVDTDGSLVEEGRVRTTESAMQRHFRNVGPMRVVLEVGTHSPWVSRLLESCGHQVLVANARKLRLIYAGDRKNDRVDARCLARVGRLDPQLLAPIRHRSGSAQADLAVLRARDALVRARAQLVNHVRGTVKAWGGRLPSCSTPAFPQRVHSSVPDALLPAVDPVLATIAELSQRVRAYDRHIEHLSATRYPETAVLRQVNGVGPLTALCYVLTLEEPNRFRKSRSVGSYLGLCPKQYASGELQRQLRITKSGDVMLRRLLVTAANYILGPFGPDCDLRRWGDHLIERGGKYARQRAVVAVARRLACLLHSMWVNDTVYEPLRHSVPIAA
ncbi:MAG: hypothetical protein AMS18_17595 [Gemmatimonas sp. SG8_17]|nr:MAG: hypothetical protein AMS18_17595 [Gemmatimonas sp. SG8_17]